MSKFMGISFDKWHGVLAFAGMVIGFMILWWLLSPAFMHSIGPGFTAFICLVTAFIIVHWLQCWNEIRQALADDLVPEYGSWRAFVINSRRDFKYFWYGVGASIGGVIIFITFCT